MNINENTTFNAPVIVKDANGNDVTVMNLYAALDKSNMNLNTVVTTINKALAAENAVEVKAQYEQFMSAVKNRATELGYVIF